MTAIIMAHLNHSNRAGNLFHSINDFDLNLIDFFIFQSATKWFHRDVSEEKPFNIKETNY